MGIFAQGLQHSRGNIQFLCGLTLRAQSRPTPCFAPMPSKLIQWLFARPQEARASSNVAPGAAGNYLDAVVLEDRLLYSVTPLPDAPVEIQAAIVDAALALAVNDATVTAEPMDSSV